MWTFGHSAHAGFWFDGSHAPWAPQPYTPWAPQSHDPWTPQPHGQWTPQPHDPWAPQPRDPWTPEPHGQWTPQPHNAWAPQPHDPWTPDPVRDHWSQPWDGQHPWWHDPRDDAGHNYLNQFETRTADGTGNNAANPDWGATDATFIRLAPAAYADGISEPIERENPREISNTIAAQDGDIPNTFGASDLFTFFGQFIDHDIDLTLDDRTDVYKTDVPAGDPVFGNKDSFEIGRSKPVDGTGETGPREHPNAITSYLDASNIYGSSDTVTGLLRADGGTSAYMRTSDGNFAPTLGEIKADNPGLPLPDEALAVGGATDDFFIAGDVRSNENVALTSMHTVWLREHNTQVDKLKALHPEWSQDDLFNSARVIVEAEYQHVVYEEYLPLLLGAENIPDYQGYNSGVNAGITHEFASAAYRLGHSQISSTIHRTNEDGSTYVDGDLNLFEAFFQPKTLVDGGGVDPIIRGLTSNLGQEVDPFIVDDVRNLLFGPPGEGQDLGVLNIMRGREHGIPPLNDVREALGLERYGDFSELSKDPEIAGKFAAVYDDVDNVDLWIGGLAENKVEGSQLGATFHTIVLDQFMRLRDGDAFYYEERLSDTPDLLAQIKGTSFSDIIQRNSDVEYLQDDVFISHERVAGTASADKMDGGEYAELMMGYDGNDVLKGKKGDDDLYGGDGHDKLKGGHGDDMLNGGHGNDKMWGGRGEDIFVFDEASGRDKVYKFDAAKDKLDISAYGYSSYEELSHAAWQQGHKVVIRFENHTEDQVHLVGVSVDELGEHNFVFDDKDGALV
jgi:Ca2+-binding RTX toxin-like protein